MKNLYQVTEFCHDFIERQVRPRDICIDATAGNGKDTEFLCSLTGEKGKVYAFDIQEKALKKTKERLEAVGMTAELILDGHEYMEKYVLEVGMVSCIVFNFGYLPGGDHTVATKAETSVAAIQSGLSLLRKGGLMSLCIYSGGDTGNQEKEAILGFLKTLDTKQYLVIVSAYFNRSNHPPVPVQIRKL
jgi:hypothetical protein